MKESKELIFEVMVMYEDILEKAIMHHNHWNDTDFEIIEVIYDDLIFCKIKVTKYTTEDLFRLGYRLSVIEHLMKEKGEIDW
ncbi:hypothetical protein [Capnocytophaga canimorsus]|uniref:hypothetical protein n=1 Tax=Capnocytophaga canimorsus TaxID=28188 RepID=UPI001AC26023|nr:hypothetical protein [Capnocytophaga canimorsus]GIM58157.1 hypothetical protein CAPN007_03640 [Capnocytophaga canimorsus]